MKEKTIDLLQIIDYSVPKKYYTKDCKENEERNGKTVSRTK